MVTVRKIAAIATTALVLPAVLIGTSATSAGAAVAPANKIVPCAAGGHGTTAAAAEAAAKANLLNAGYDEVLDPITLSATGSGTSWNGVASARCFIDTE